MIDFSLLRIGGREAVLAQIRDARYAFGVHCVHCRATTVQRWGSFSGRQRYRCKHCLRTFSDLTGTPAAYSKKIELWPAYGSAMQSSMTLRQAAAQLSIQASTAFRWRHALLRGLREFDREKVGGWMEIRSLWFALNEKGCRKLTRPARKHVVRHRLCSSVPGQNVVIAADRSGHVVSAQYGKPAIATRTPLPSELATALAALVGGPPIVSMEQGRFCGGGILAARLRGQFHHSDFRTRKNPLTLVHVRTARGYVVRLRRWLPRFRGVATRYLMNYLMWHRELDRTERNCVSTSALRWPLNRECG